MTAKGLLSWRLQPVYHKVLFSVSLLVTADMTVRIFSGLLVDNRTDWSLRAEEGVLVVQGSRIVERSSEEVGTVAARLVVLSEMLSNTTYLCTYTTQVLRPPGERSQPHLQPVPPPGSD